MRACGIIGILLLAGAWGTAANAAPAASSEKAALGAAGFVPTPAQTVGWRGDGTGRYPAAVPPMAWQRTKSDAGYAGKGIAWMAPLPSTGVSCPIVVGDRIYLTCEVSDVVCLDKKSGRILWIRSNPEFEALDANELKADPAFAEKLQPLTAELARANAELVEELNAKIPKAMAEPASQTPAMKTKKDLEKKIADELKAIDKKKFERYWGQAVFGFAGPTPCSDGKHVCAFFTTGVSVCYDPDGKRQWIARGKGTGAEHGNFASPLLCENQFIVWAGEMRSYDVATGKLLWSNPGKSGNSYGSMFRFKSGNETVAAFQSGSFTRLRDGKAIWGDEVFGDSVTTPIVEGGAILTAIGYPRNGGKSAFTAYKIPASTDAALGTPAITYETEWKDEEVPVVKGKSDFARGYVASPLFVDGLIYRITQAGGLIVNDAASGAVVYRKVLPLESKTHYWDWAGCSASPTLAGKYIYLMDNTGHTVIIQPGKVYKEVASNNLEDLRDGKEQIQCVSTPVFEGTRMYYRTPDYLYCIGEK